MFCKEQGLVGLGWKARTPALGGDRLHTRRTLFLGAGLELHTLGTCLLTEVVRRRLEHKVHRMNLRQSGAGKGGTYPGLGCRASRSACCLLWPEAALSLLGAERLTEGQMPPHSEAEPGHVPKKSGPVSVPPLHMGILLPESKSGTSPSSSSPTPALTTAPPDHRPTSSSDHFLLSSCSSLDQGSESGALTEPTEALGCPLYITSNLVSWLAHSKYLNNQTIP